MMKLEDSSGCPTTGPQYQWLFDMRPTLLHWGSVDRNPGHRLCYLLFYRIVLRAVT